MKDFLWLVPRPFFLNMLLKKTKYSLFKKKKSLVWHVVGHIDRSSLFTSLDTIHKISLGIQINKWIF